MPAGHALQRRYGGRVAAPVSAAMFCLADGQRQSGPIQPLAPLAGDRPPHPHRGGAAPRQHPGDAACGSGAALRNCPKPYTAPCHHRAGWRTKSAKRHPIAPPWSCRARHARQGPPTGGRILKAVKKNPAPKAAKKPAKKAAAKKPASKTAARKPAGKKSVKAK